MELAAHEARYDRLCRFFCDQFPGRTPRIIVRAPGRVNLIGEHTDYNGYPVLPMAIDRDFVFAIAPADDRGIRLFNEDPSFEPRSFSAEFPVSPYSQGDWGNYVKAAVHGVLDAGFIDPKNARGFDAAIGGTIPESAGLSSSSALVVASALAFLAANQTEVEPGALAELLARAERYVGSEGGGMDQAVSLLAETGRALMIDFFPLTATPAPLPGDIMFVVCNSLVRAPKSESVRYAYNSRVIECRLATALLARIVEEKIGRKIPAARLADLSAKNLGLEPAILNSWAQEAIGGQPLRLQEVARRLAMAPHAVETELCRLRDGSVLKEPPGGFRVWERYRHVVSEAERVRQMADALSEGNLTGIGSLMNQSHASCRDDYEISCPELEALVSIALESGALGSRLTGAGFGGCTVSAVRRESLDQFLSGVEAGYYDGFVNREGSRPFVAFQKLSDVMFPCRASMGAGYWQAQ
ncbi:MAG TPA: galactokinase [Bacteroidota bacterium]|nr:galactokinase [Bacteroidota bacterium]